MKKDSMRKIGGSLLVSLLLLNGCNLDRLPKDYTRYDQSYQTLQDAAKWDNGVYSTLRGKFGGGYVLPQEVQADMLNAHASFGGLYGSFHKWDIKSEDEVLKQVYHSYYAALVDVNVVIESAPKLEVSPQEQSAVDVYMGNAYLARAFYHFSLAIRWGMPYREESADNDLSVPLQTTPFSLVKEGRATNRKAYGLILEDLDKAEKLLSSVPCVEGSEELSSDVARALRARVYLYMGKMEEALAEAEKLIQSQRYPLIAVLAEGGKDGSGEENPFIRMWHYDSGKEQIWQPFVDKEKEVPTITNLYGADLETWNYWSTKDPGNKENFNKPSYLPTGTVVYDLFHDEKDRRVPAYFEWVNTTVTNKDVKAMVCVISKFKGNPKYRTLDNPQWGGYVPNGICAPKPFRIAEQYLIAAEAAYESNNTEKATSYLNDLRASRGLDQVSAIGEELRKAIRDERGRELAFEGYRLWDLSRWGDPIPKRTRQGMVQQHEVPAHFFADGFDLGNEGIKANHQKFIWGFPKDEVNQINRQVKQNEGWD